ncbi:hypothetical protein GDO86_007198, partial [Hymenochirus boettgeri]
VREDKKVEPATPVSENLERRRKRRDPPPEQILPEPEVPSATKDVKPSEESTQVDATESDAAPAEVEETPASTNVGVNTRRSSQAAEVTAEKPAAKPIPPKSSRPRPKSRMSRYRSGSAQRLRRQRQAVAQQVEQVQIVTEEGTVTSCATASEAGTAECLGQSGNQHGSDSPLVTQSVAQPSRASLKYHKTKKYLVTEWLNDKVEKQDIPIEHPLRITTDPTVLATTLNMLPGLSHSPSICTAPKHYIRFVSPSMPERRRRPPKADGTYGSCKKRWMKQAMEEIKTQPASPPQEKPHMVYQSNESSSCSINSTGSTAPFKKWKLKYVLEENSSNLTSPPSFVTPPLLPLTADSPSPLQTTPSSSLPGEEESRFGYGLMFSPIPSLAASRCNTPLQFENISSPESSPAHRPESLSPEPCLRPDLDLQKVIFLDSTVENCPDQSAASTCPPELAGQSPSSSIQYGGPSENIFLGKSMDGSTVLRTSEQAVRTEFSLMYAFSPLNAMPRADGSLRGSPLVGDRKPSQSEGFCGSPVEAYHGRLGTGFLKESTQGSMSPCSERNCDGIRSSPQNPPQRKKVSLLEYRKRKQEAKEIVSSPSGDIFRCMGTPTRQSSNGSLSDTDMTTSLHFQAQSSPQSGFSSPVHPSMPQIEDVSPPDNKSAGASVSHSRHPENISSRWMVPTSVERLREGQGILERVLRSGVKVSHIGEPSPSRDLTGDRESEEGDLEMPVMAVTKGPTVYSPSRYNYQFLQCDSPQSETQNLPAQSSSPFRGPSSQSVGYSYRTPQRAGHTLSEPSVISSTYSSPAHTASMDSPATQCSGGPGYYNSQQLYGSNAGTSQPRKSFHHRGPSCEASPAQLLRTDSSTTDSQPNTGPPSNSSIPQGSRSDSRTITLPSPGHQSSRISALSSPQHCPQRGAGVHQYRLQQIQGSGVKSQTGFS